MEQTTDPDSPSTAVQLRSDFFHGEVGAPPGALFVKDSILEERGALIDLASSIAPPGYFTPIEDRGTDLIEGYFLPGEVFPNSEETLAAYLSGSFGADLANGMKISGNLGVRYVHTTDESSGAVNFAPSSQVIPDAFGGDFGAYCAGFAGSPGGQVPALCQPGVTAAQQQAALDFANGASVPDVAKNSFDHWLPSLNLRLDASDELVFRFAASKAISRPDFANLRNYVGLTYNGQTGGFTARSLNPFLEPVEAWQFDLTAEWYFDTVGSLTLAMFYKDIDNIVVSNQVYSRDLTNNGVTLPVSVSGPANTTGSSKIKGAEVAYQQTFDFLPGALAGFGTQVSYTYIDVGSIVIGPPAYAPSNNLTETGNQPTIDITGLYENLPLEGPMAKAWNIKMFQHISTAANEASMMLAHERGPCPDAEEMGAMERFSCKMAIAPTASISIICGGTSACIEPIPANIYTHKTLSGSFIVKNPYLQELLAKKSKDSTNVWNSILERGGSVQHLDFLTPEEKAVYKTSFEIDQRWLLEFAGDRAGYIDQAQSLNLFIPADVDKWDLMMLHYRAWELGIKSLYYLRSKAVQRAGFAGGVEADNTIDKPELQLPNTDFDECIACT